jgi:hypothetical protein
MLRMADAVCSDKPILRAISAPTSQRILASSRSCSFACGASLEPSEI